MRAQITPSSGNVFADMNLPHAEQLLGTADRLRAILDALRLAYTALKDAEWAAYDCDPYCPVCSAAKDEVTGHAADCTLAAALAAIRALLPDVDGEEG